MSSSLLVTLKATGFVSVSSSSSVCERTVVPPTVFPSSDNTSVTSALRTSVTFVSRTSVALLLSISVALLSLNTSVAVLLSDSVGEEPTLEPSLIPSASPAVPPFFFERFPLNEPVALSSRFEA